MNKNNKDKLCIIVVFVTILLGLLACACVMNRIEIDKLKKDVIILINKENKK